MVSPIYTELKRCAIAGESSWLPTRSEDGHVTDVTSVWSRDGRFLQLFVTRAAALKEQEKQWKRLQSYLNRKGE